MKEKTGYIASQKFCRIVFQGLLRTSYYVLRNEASPTPYAAILPKHPTYVL